MARYENQTHKIREVFESSEVLEKAVSQRRADIDSATTQIQSIQAASKDVWKAQKIIDTGWLVAENNCINWYMDFPRITKRSCNAINVAPVIQSIPGLGSDRIRFTQFWQQVEPTNPVSDDGVMRARLCLSLFIFTEDEPVIRNFVGRFIIQIIHPDTL